MFLAGFEVRELDGGEAFISVEDGDPSAMRWTGTLVVWRRHALGEWVAVYESGGRRHRGTGRTASGAVRRAWDAYNCGLAFKPGSRPVSRVRRGHG